jgi:hypothetical protein
MAKNISKGQNKVNFGTRKKGKAKKRLNKHESKKIYIGQGK